jgi:hypothetical protein
MINESEEWVDKIVVEMEVCLERKGSLLKETYFQFNDSDCAKLALTQEQLDVALNKAVSLGCIEKDIWGRDNTYSLTEEGRARARSCMLRKNDGKLGHSVIVNGDNANIQVGNNNVQNVSNVFKFIIEQIDKSNATSEEKRSAKESLKKFIEHPLVNTVFGTVGGALANLL